MIIKVTEQIAHTGCHERNVGGISLHVRCVQFNFTTDACWFSRLRDCIHRVKANSLNKCKITFGLEASYKSNAKLGLGLWAL